MEQSWVRGFVSRLISVSVLHLLFHHHPESSLFAKVGGKVVPTFDFQRHRLVASHVRSVVTVRWLVVHLSLGTRIARFVHFGGEGDQAVEVGRHAHFELLLPLNVVVVHVTCFEHEKMKSHPKGFQLRPDTTRSRR